MDQHFDYLIWRLHKQALCRVISYAMHTCAIAMEYSFNRSGAVKVKYYLMLALFNENIMPNNMINIWNFILFIVLYMHYVMLYYVMLYTYACVYIFIVQVK